MYQSLRENVTRVVPGRLQASLTTLRTLAEVARPAGLAIDDRQSEYEVVESTPYYRLRRYFSTQPDGHPTLLVPPLMYTADVFDIDLEEGPVAQIAEAGLSAWVVDFGSPAEEENGWHRDLSDHVLAVSDAIERVARLTGQPVHVAGYCQGGMFAYQAAAHRRCRDVASVIGIASIVDWEMSNAPIGYRVAEFCAKRVRTGPPVTDGFLQAWFNLINPITRMRRRIDTIRNATDRASMLAAERRRSFAGGRGRGRLGYPGPAASDLLTQFAMKNRLLRGGFVIDGKPVSLAALTVPVLAVVGLSDQWAPPASVRAIVRAAVNTEVYELPIEAGHYPLVTGDTAIKQTWPGVIKWVQEIVNDGLIESFERLSDSSVVASKPEHRGLKAIRFAGPARARMPISWGRGPRPISLGRLLAEQASADESVIAEGVLLSGAEVDNQIDTVMRRLLKLEIKKNDDVVVKMTAHPSSLYVVAALSRIGAIPVLLTGGSIDSILDTTDVEHAIVPTGSTLLVCSLARMRMSKQRDRSITDVAKFSIDASTIDASRVRLPTGFVPNPGRPRDVAFKYFENYTQSTPHLRTLTNAEWARAAYSSIDSLDLDPRDTVLLWRWDDAVHTLSAISGSLIAKARLAFIDHEAPDREIAQRAKDFGVTITINPRENRSHTRESVFNDR